MSSQLIKICSWCLPGRIAILGDGVRLEPGEKLSLAVDKNTGFVNAAWITTAGGEIRDLTISHGICPECQLAARGRVASSRVM